MTRVHGRRPTSALTKPTAALAVAALGLIGSGGCRGEAAQSEPAGRMAGAGAAPVALTAQAGDGGVAPVARLRRLWAGQDFNFYASSPSPDGRWVTEIDWSTGDLAVRDLTTGRLHHLTDKGSWDELDYAEVSRFSPDGRRVAYVWFDEAVRDYQLRVLDFSIDGEGRPRALDPRVVYPGGALEVYWLYGWSPDDEILAGVYRPDNTTALAFLSLATGTLRVLKSFDWRDARAALSPDGRWVAYDHPPGPDPADRDIYLLSADGRRETKLIEGPGNDVVLGWMPGDGSLMFHSDRSGSPSVWRLPMSDGAAAGPAELLRGDVRGLEPLGFAGDAFYFGVVVDAPAFRTAAIDFDGRRLLSLPTVFRPPATATHGCRGHSCIGIRALAWSPDGGHVVHDVHGPARTRIYLRTAEGEVIQEWSFELHMQRWLMRWAPDGKSVLFPAIDGRGRDGIFRLDLASGELALVRRFAPRETDRAFSVSPDGRTLYFTRTRTVDGELVEGFNEVVALDLESGAERPIQRVRHWGPVLVSPDGAWLAYMERGPGGDKAIRLFPVDGGEPRILHRWETGTINALAAWTPDGGSLLFVTAPRWPDPPFELWRVSRTGGDAERLGETAERRVDGPVLHPDGRTIAYRAGQNRGEIWALDGIAPSSRMQPFLPDTLEQLDPEREP